jgi:hypothetical protein
MTLGTFGFVSVGGEQDAAGGWGMVSLPACCAERCPRRPEQTDVAEKQLCKYRTELSPWIQ